MPKFVTGENVWVPSTYLSGEQPFALMDRRVLGHSDRSVVVDDRGGATVRVSSRVVHHRSLGFLVLRVGDLETETLLLDPLAKSILQFLRLLIPDDAVHALSVRTLAEVKQFWTVKADSISHVVLIGHGSPDAIRFVGSGELTGASLGAILTSATPTTRPKTFVSLACSTGQAPFGRGLSASPVCRDLVAPFRSVHGAAASLFFQTLLTWHLLRGREFVAAARIADQATPGSKFRHWRDGDCRS